jgi:hypothetical protein
MDREVDLVDVEDFKAVLLEVLHSLAVISIQCNRGSTSKLDTP